MTLPRVQLPTLRAFLGAMGLAKTTTASATRGLYSLRQAFGQEPLTDSDAAVRDVVNALVTVAPISVVSFGATGDGATDDAAAIQAAITAASNAGGGEVIVPTGTYRVGATIAVPSRVTLRGAGRGQTTIREHASLGNAALVTIGTNGGAQVTDVVIAGISFRNGTAVTSSPTVQHGIVIDTATRVDVTDCTFTEIQGSSAVLIHNASNVWIDGCYFYRWSAGGVSLLTLCSDVHIVGNLLDTAVATSGTAYGISTGYTGSYPGESYYVKRVWIQGNTVKNVAAWEGIDTHGGEDIWIADNYVENAHIGIHVALVAAGCAGPVLKNVHVTGNRLVGASDTATGGGYGVVVTGDVTAGAVTWAETVEVSGNKISGFGAANADPHQCTVGAITVFAARDVRIERNALDDYRGAGVCLYYAVQDCSIVGNRFGNFHYDATYSTAYAVILQGAGLYGLRITGNNVDASTYPPLYFVQPNNYYVIEAQIADNTIKTLGGANLYDPSYVGNIPVEYAAIPTNKLVLRYGDAVYNTSGKVGWTCTAPKIGYGCVYTSSVLGTCTGTTGQSTVTLPNDGTWQKYPVGANLTIAGAGSASGNLNARVLTNTGTTLTLDTALGTSVVGANITWQAATVA